MFAPEGYLPWGEIQSHIDHWSRLLALAEIEKSKGNPVASVFDPSNYNHRQAFDYSEVENGLVQSGICKSLNEARFSREVHKTWLLAQFLVAFPPILANAHGATFTAPDAIFLHADMLELTPWGFQMTNNGYFHRFYQNHLNNPDLDSGINERFPYLDMHTGQIIIRNNSVRLLQSNIGFEFDTYAKAIHKSIQPFAGHFMCWKPDAIPTQYDKLFDELSLPASDWNDECIPPTNRGKPFGRYAKVVSEILQVYPEKRTETWTVVEKRTGYTRRHIIRALRDAGRYEIWNDCS